MTTHTHSTQPEKALLSVRDLGVEFDGRPVVNGVSFDVLPGQVVGLVGESGCGKSVTSLAIMGLLKQGNPRVSGSVRFGDTDLLTLSDREMSDIRGRDLGMIFQDPLSSLNPVLPLGIQLTEVLTRHRKIGRKAARVRAEELLDMVGIPDARRRMREYPHQLSGGMRQRALIAIALACEPKLLIADEPTTALDVTIQAQILALLAEIVRELGTALVLITHDMGVVAGHCDEVNVMYGGRIVEHADRFALFRNPQHPYTAGLLSSIPRLQDPLGSRLQPIPGSVADNIPWDNACAFAPRCANATSACRSSSPELVSPEGQRNRLLRCWNPLPAVAADPALSTLSSKESSL